MISFFMFREFEKNEERTSFCDCRVMLFNALMGGVLLLSCGGVVEWSLVAVPEEAGNPLVVLFCAFTEAFPFFTKV